MKKTFNLFCLLMLSLALVNCTESEDAPAKSSEKELLSFTLTGVPGSISATDKTVNLSLPVGTDVRSLAPTITVSNKARVTPASDTVQNFSQPVRYTVTAEDGTFAVYLVTVMVPLDTIPVSDTTSVTDTTSLAKPVITATATSLCAGGAVTLTASNSMVGATYTWYKDGLQIAGVAGATFIVTQAGSYTVVAKAGAQTSQASNAVVVTSGLPANFKPVITVSLPTLCGDSTVLRVSNPVAGASYQWYNNSGVIVGATAVSITARQSGEYRVVAKLDSCSSQASNVVTVTINAFVGPAKPVITTTSATLCIGGSTTLTVSNPVTGATYTWFKDGVLLAGTASSTYVATQAGTYTVVANVGGCSSLVSNMVVVTINAFVSSTQPVITVSSPTSCSDTTMVLTASSPIVGATYTWYKNGVQMAGTTGSTYVTSQAGSYMVVANLGGCSSLASSAVVVTASAPANPRPVITALSTTVCAGGSTTLTVSNPLAGATYTWYKDGVQLASTTSNTYMATQVGSYMVRSTVGGCSSLTSNAISVIPCVQ